MSVGHRNGETRRRRALVAVLPNLLTQHRGVVPRKAQLRIRGVAPQRPKRLRTTGVVVEEDVPFCSLHQCQHVDVLTHGGYLLTRLRPSLGRRRTRCESLFGLGSYYCYRTVAHPGTIRQTVSHWCGLRNHFRQKAANRPPPSSSAYCHDCQWQCIFLAAELSANSASFLQSAQRLPFTGDDAGGSDCTVEQKRRKMGSEFGLRKSETWIAILAALPDRRYNNSRDVTQSR